MVYERLINTPIGFLTLMSDGEHLTRICFGEHTAGLSSCAVLEQTERQLREYFSGERRVFDVPLETGGTQFQRLVWNALREIPYGQTVSYAELARRIGRATACRAVGGANHRNPIPIIIPCHRVIGQNGRLTGYAGGIEIKQMLLDLER